MKMSPFMEKFPLSRAKNKTWNFLDRMKEQALMSPDNLPWALSGGFAGKITGTKTKFKELVHQLALMSPWPTRHSSIFSTHIGPVSKSLKETFGILPLVTHRQISDRPMDFGELEALQLMTPWVQKSQGQKEGKIGRRSIISIKKLKIW